MKTLMAARLSLVCIATLAALALQLAQDSAGWTAGCLTAGLLACLCIDLLRLLRPIPSVWGFVPILLAATVCFVEWQWTGGTSKTAAAACVHFILLCQVAAIYSDLAGPQIGMSLAGSVVLLLVAVKQQPSPWHLPLVIAVVAAAAACLIFRAILLRETEYQAHLLRARSGGPDSFVPADRHFARRMVLVTLGLSLTAAGIGLFAFFFFPRVSFASPTPENGAGESPTTQEIIGQLYPSRKSGPDGKEGKGRDGGIRGGVGGPERNVRLDLYGQILKQPGDALRLTREKIDASKPLPGGPIYLRGGTLSRYESGRWQDGQSSIKEALVRKADDPRWYRLDFEKDRNQLIGAGVSEILTVTVVDPNPSSTLFVPGAADGLESSLLPGRPDRDTDGMISIGLVPPTRYRWLTQVGTAKLDASQPDALAHPYGAMTGLQIALRPDLLELAGRAASGAATDQGKALAILRFLRDSGEYSYTLDIPPTPAESSDPIDYFLLGSKRGHCAFFATGFVVLARLNNLACRLANGFCVRTEQDQTEVTVKNADAHAWVEVYIANKGWVTLDPTPAGANAAALAAARAAGTVGPDGKTPAATAQAGTDGNKPAAKTPGDTASAPVPDPITGFTTDRQSALYEGFLDVLNFGFFTVAGLTLRLWQVLILALLATLAWRLRDVLRGQEEFSLEFGEAARAGGTKIAFYRRMLAIQKSRGFVRQATQSATEFAYLAQRRGDPGAKAVALITNVYLLMRFGALPEPERRAAWQRYRAAVEDRLKDLELLRAVEKAGASAGAASTAK